MLRPIVVDFTKKVHEQITEEQWTKGISVSDDYGNICKRCIMMWVQNRYLQSNREEYRAIVDRIVKDVHVAHSGTMLMWNDAPERTFADVKNLLTKLDI